jgi:hypothetical protein
MRTPEEWCAYVISLSCYMVRSFGVLSDCGGAGLHVFSGKDLGMARNSSQYVWKHVQTAQA